MKPTSAEIYDLVVIGGGAAGFFGAIQAAEMCSGLRVLIVEKTSKLLSKVKVSGGGRCNVTHHCFDPFKLAHHYPRGEKQLKHLFKSYQAKQVVEWFAAKGVALKAEEDGRMFPVTDSSETIIRCFMDEALRHGIRIEMGVGVAEILHEENVFRLRSGEQEFLAKKVLVATGGSPQRNAYQFIEKLGHSISLPIPSLFTFNDVALQFKDLMGVAVPQAEVRISGTKFSQQGPLLITHWGLSGPAVIKLSAWAAEYLHQIHYTFTALVSWIGPMKEETLRSQLHEHKQVNGRQKIYTHPMFSLPQRLWERLCVRAEIEEHKIWAELPNRNLNKLIEFLIRCPFTIKGKTTFKEEFVTCGGVLLSEIQPDTMESKICKHLFFAGEVLHIDGETGGFNFQAAWTTAYLAAKAITAD